MPIIQLLGPGVASVGTLALMLHGPTSSDLAPITLRDSPYLYCKCPQDPIRTPDPNPGAVYVPILWAYIAMPSEKRICALRDPLPLPPCQSRVGKRTNKYTAERMTAQRPNLPQPSAPPPKFLRSLSLGTRLLTLYNKAPAGQQRCWQQSAWVLVGIGIRVGARVGDRFRIGATISVRVGVRVELGVGILQGTWGGGGGS